MVKAKCFAGPTLITKDDLLLSLQILLDTTILCNKSRCLKSAEISEGVFPFLGKRENITTFDVRHSTSLDV